MHAYVQYILIDPNTAVVQCKLKTNFTTLLSQLMPAVKYFANLACY